MDFGVDCEEPTGGVLRLSPSTPPPRQLTSRLKLALISEGKASIFILLLGLDFNLCTNIFSSKTISVFVFLFCIKTTKGPLLGFFFSSIFFCFVLVFFHLFARSCWMSVPGSFALIQQLVMFYNFLVVKKNQILHFLFFIGSRMMMVKKKKIHDFRPGMIYTRAQSAVLTRATDLRSVSVDMCREAFTNHEAELHLIWRVDKSIMLCP